MSIVHNIKRTKEGYDVLFWGYAFGLILTVVCVLSLRVYPIFSIVFLVVIFKYFFYRVADFFFDKTICLNENEFYIQVGFIRLNLNKHSERKERASFLVIENVAASTKTSEINYGLVLVRNNEKWYRRLFKNKIKLYAAGSDTKLEDVGEQIAEKFNIHFIGKYESF